MQQPPPAGSQAPPRSGTLAVGRHSARPHLQHPPERHAGDLVGDSGALKSTMAALLLGISATSASCTELPAHFEDTENAVEKLVFFGQDVSFVVDEFSAGVALRPSAGGGETLSPAGAGCGQSDGAPAHAGGYSALRPQYYPRGWSSPPASCAPKACPYRRRDLLPTPFAKGEINIQRLTQVQQLLHVLPQATAAYIRSLSRMQDLSQQLPVQFEVLRDRAQQRPMP